MATNAATASTATTTANCQDNPTTWLDWQKADPELGSHIRALIALRKQLAADGVYDDWWHHESARWYNANGEAMRDADWHDEASKALALKLQDKYLILFNANRDEKNLRPARRRLATAAWRRTETRKPP